MSQTIDQLQQSYNDFIDTVRETRTVWGLRSNDGWVVCDSEEFEDADVIPFWARREEAVAQCSDAWADNEPVSIELEEFLDQWLIEMAEDGSLAGPGWNQDLEGLEIEPVELARRLFDEEHANN